MKEPTLDRGEKLYKFAQGSFQERSFRSSWKLGHLYLTKRRLFFIQVTKWIFSVSLDKIIDISVVKRGWLVGVKVKQLCISFSEKGRIRTVYIALEKPEKWREEILELMTLYLADIRWYDGANSKSTDNAQ